MDFCINFHTTILRNQFFGDWDPLMYCYALLHNYEKSEISISIKGKGRNRNYASRIEPFEGHVCIARHSSRLVVSRLVIHTGIVFHTVNQSALSRYMRKGYLALTIVTYFDMLSMRSILVIPSQCSI